MASNVNQPPDAQDQAAAHQSGAVPTRRQMLRRVGAASPVLMTMVSLPVHADPIGFPGDVCINPSGFISQNTFNSRHPGGLPPPCTTLGPTHFQNLARGSWPAGTSTLVFSAVFGGIESPMVAPNTLRPMAAPSKLPPSVTGTTLSEVLAVGSPYTAFTKYCVAAFLNTKAGTPGFPMTQAQSQALWPTIRGPLPGTPFPALSLGWNEATTVSWLQTVMSV